MARKPRIHYPGAILACATRLLLDEKSCSHGPSGHGQTPCKTNAKHSPAICTDLTKNRPMYEKMKQIKNQITTIRKA